MRELRRFTPARIGLTRAGNSLSTRDLLDFQLDHARARDAVHTPLDTRALTAELEAAGLSSLVVGSAARDRAEYLRRPDLGRLLDKPSREALKKSGGPFDLVFIAADGLSPLSVQTQAVPLLSAVSARLDRGQWNIAPVVIATQSRVALSDEIGSITRSALTVMLIGERPGLSSHDSMGAYLTWAPQSGRTDADRNCISNVRAEGLSIGAACELLLLLLREARRLKLSGIALKPENPPRGLDAPGFI